MRIVQDGEVVHDRTGKRDFTLKAGTGHVEVFEKDGSRLASKPFELSRNGKTTLKLSNQELADARLPIKAQPIGARNPAEANAPPRPVAPGEWQDILSLVDPAQHAVSGPWKRDGGELSIGGREYSRLLLPFQPQGSYELRVRLTRKVGIAEINFVLPVRSTYCLASIWDNKTAGFQLPGADSVRYAKSDIFANGSPQEVLIRVQTDGNEAQLDFEIDGQLPQHWRGPIQSINGREVWRIPDGCLGLGVHSDTVVFHSAELRMLNGMANPWTAAKPGESIAADRSLDVLPLVDIEKHLVTGTWSRTPDGLRCESGPFARVAIPIVPDGGYEIQIRFTRLAGTADNVLILPVGRTACACAIFPDAIELQIASSKGNGAVRGRFPQTPLTDEKKHTITARVVLEPALARVQVEVDGKQQIDWSGPQSALSPREEWRLFPNSLGVGSHNQGIVFHSARLRTLTGKAVGLLWPGVADRTATRCLSLSGVATATLSESLDFADNDLKSLPIGRRKFGGIPFEVNNGILQLDSSKTRKPNKIEGIKVGRTAKQLHFLQGIRGYTSVNQIVAKYVIHYDDGTTADTDVVYGRDVTNWWVYSDNKAPKKEPAAWEGENGSSKGASAKIRLYLMTWENPKPGKVITNIDFIAQDTGVALAPFCVAITSENE